MPDARHDDVTPSGVGGHRKGRVPRAVREQQLLDVAEELFLDKGYEATSIEDVCRRADVSRPIVYDLIGNKAALYLACVRRARGALEQALAEAVTAASDPREQLRCGADAYFRILERDPRRYELLFGTTGAVGELGEELTEERSRTVQAIAALLLDLAPEAPAERLLAYANLISGAAEQLGRWWVRNPQIPRETIVDLHATFAWSGVQGLIESA
jgi:AcrR family transcriptional regulator